MDRDTDFAIKGIEEAIKVVRMVRDMCGDPEQGRKLSVAITNAEQAILWLRHAGRA